MNSKTKTVVETVVECFMIGLVTALATAFCMLFLTKALKVDAAEADVSTEATLMAGLVNQVREAQGLPALTVDEDLCASATTRAIEATALFAHVRPDGSEYWTVNERIYSENLARANGDWATTTITGWVNSPKHLANVLKADATSIGIGVVYNQADGLYYICMVTD